MKSSVTQAVYRALGDYAKEFDIALLTKSKHGVASNAARPELIALEGVRIAWTEETPDDFVIDEQMLKGLTSSGVKSARQLYGKQRIIELICSFVVESNGTFDFDIENEDQQEAAMDRTKVMRFVRTPRCTRFITAESHSITQKQDMITRPFGCPILSPSLPDSRRASIKQCATGHWRFLLWFLKAGVQIKMS